MLFGLHNGHHANIYEILYVYIPTKLAGIHDQLPFVVKYSLKISICINY